jgi:predicted double-glycine peptidase
MVLRDLGVNASEQQIARALGTTTEGASVLDITGAMREMGIPRRPGRARSRIRGITASRGGTVSQLESSLAQGDRVVASISEGGGLHAVVVDHIAEGRVFIRDPLPTDLGHSYSISVADFERVYSGRSATFVTGGRAR